MSLICLSSRGLSDTPVEFTNYFGGRGVEFPDNSEICLIGASIRKHAPGRVTVTITPETNTFAAHWGRVNVGVDDNLHRDDIFTCKSITADQNDMATELLLAIQEQCTISPIRYGVNSTIAAAGWTMTINLAQLRNESPGNWLSVPNLPINNAVVGIIGANSTTLIPTPAECCFVEDSRRLWNVDNQATAANFATETEGARFVWTWTGGDPNSAYDGMQGGIVTGNRLGNGYAPSSWVNFPVGSNAQAPDLDAYEQKIDIGWEIEENNIKFYKNAFDATSGYRRVYLGASVPIPPLPGDQDIELCFRPVKVVNNYGWELFYQINGGGYVQHIVIAGTEAAGNFPIGQYNGNQSPVKPIGIGLNCVMSWGKNNDADVEVFGCYDNDAANVTAVAPLTSWGNCVFATSYISDFYATYQNVSLGFKQIAQTRCNVADALGFYSGVIHQVANTSVPGLQSDEATSRWNFHDTPFAVQLPNLPITGYLGGGASSAGGATALPLLGIVEGFQVDEDPTNATYEPSNENWVKLENKHSFTVNELQVRITDLYGVVPEYLDAPTHVWIKIRAGRGTEKI